MPMDPLSTSTGRLAALRQAMRQHALDAWWLPSSDPHCSEYLPDHWNGRAWLSGFDGSVGTLVITQQCAGLWVDCRYWEQAERQLAGSGIALMKLLPGQPDAAITWLADQMEPGQTLGLAPEVVSWGVARRLQQTLGAKGIHIHAEHDLLEDIWSSRPALPQSPLYAHDRRYLDEAPADRLERIRQAMSSHQVDCHLISSLDDIAWITQLRGSDVVYNPLFLSHFMVEQHRAILFTSIDRISDEQSDFLHRNGIDIADYGQWLSYLSSLSSLRVLMDPEKISLATRKALPEDAHIVEDYQPSSIFKGQKRDREILHIRAVMQQDGAALCEAFAWIEDQLYQGSKVSEWDVDQALLKARAAREGFISRSFGTMCGFNANGAQPHYQPSAESHALIEGDGLLLIDSGAHYQGGTTDITRMLAIGQPNAAQCRDVTLVLKGLIVLSRAKFPRGLPSPFLDPLARAPLWAEGCDYGHGTGHGVGYFLNVHEGPQSIAWYTPPEAHTAMQPDMITSIEPGQYHPGKWGARLENLVLTRVSEDRNGQQFLRFETLTLCPIDTRCLDLTRLDDSEIAWINAYHEEVRQRLASELDGNALAWLMERTTPLPAAAPLSL